MAQVPARSRLKALDALAHPGILFALLLFVAVPAFAGTTTLAWDPVTSPSLVGYMAYYGPAAGNYPSSIDVGNTTSYAISNLAEGATYHFAATAYDAAHTESGFSNDVSATVPYSAPVAQFNASTTSGTTPLALNFTSTSTGTISTYAWTFGDATTSSAQNPSHVYAAAGVYTVSLTVTGPGGSNTQTRSNYITVSPSPPVAGFSASTTSGTAPLAVNFTSASTGTISTYAWTFGDATTSSAQNPSHVYSAAGVYTVSLTISGPGGNDTHTNSDYLTVTTQNHTLGPVTRTTNAKCPCSLWKQTAAPALAADPDTSSVELGVKFQSNKNGLITGIRFYKARTNTGTHVGSLWSSGGTLLAQATFTSESRAGWQQVNFSTSVPITANTVYVASYHTDVGHYANDISFFATAGVDNGPLKALRDGISGSNSVYKYSTSPAFPSFGHQASNFWVDVVFMPTN
jgi:PKD repeat protein